MIAYRSASGFGIRLDAGSAFPGQLFLLLRQLVGESNCMGSYDGWSSNQASPCTAEFRIRGVKTNIDFLLNLLRDETFVKGEATVNFIKEHPELFNLPRRQDRGTKMLNYLAGIVVNGNEDIKFRDERLTTFPPTSGTCLQC
ncbi:MAG: hypothetical protein R2769_12120 [Saprospiraceae bacterium]